jgi:UDP-N-acetylmuramoylalanine--D-glutamate ligase
MYKDLKILLLGGARSGISAAKLICEGNDVTLCDMKELNEEDRKELESLGVKIIISDHQEDIIDDSWDLIIKNPAIPYVSKVYQKCLELNLKVINELELAYHFLPKSTTIIGVTGSNGKTTTSTIIYELIKDLGRKVYLGGNIGTALCSFVKDIEENSILLLEISDHQLVDFRDFKTDISVLTNISPTHLDYHGSYEHYKQTKGRIFNNHDENCLAIINKANNDAMEVSQGIKSKVEYFNDNNNYFDDKGIYIDKKLVIRLDEIKLLGNHNYENILCALLVMKEFNLDIDTVKRVLKNFGGVEHRLEYVTELNGVKYYNDSKATNPEATITALKTFKSNIHLILGGQERFQDFNDLNDYMKYVGTIYAVGTTTQRVCEYAAGIGKKCYECKYLKNAMDKIKENVKPGDIVLLSTASASQDFYKKFEDRGDEFKNIIKSWQE